MYDILWVSLYLTGFEVVLIMQKKKLKHPFLQTWFSFFSISKVYKLPALLCATLLYKFYLNIIARIYLRVCLLFIVDLKSPQNHYYHSISFKSAPHSNLNWHYCCLSCVIKELVHWMQHGFTSIYVYLFAYTLLKMYQLFSIFF